MNFKTAVWRDPATEQYFARIFPEPALDNLAAWGLSANDVQPVTLQRTSLRGPHGLGVAITDELARLGLLDAKFKPVFLGDQPHDADVRALLESKLAAIAA